MEDKIRCGYDRLYGWFLFYFTITVRRPRVGDLRAVAHIASEAEQGLALVSQITGLVPEDLDMLDLKDLERIQATFRAQSEQQPENAADA